MLAEVWPWERLMIGCKRTTTGGDRCRGMVECEPVSGRFSRTYDELDGGNIASAIGLDEERVRRGEGEGRGGEGRGGDRTGQVRRGRRDGTRRERRRGISDCGYQERVLSLARGDVLEVGVGTGLNLPKYNGGGWRIRSKRSRKKSPEARVEAEMQTFSKCPRFLLIVSYLISSLLTLSSPVCTLLLISVFYRFSTSKDSVKTVTGIDLSPGMLQQESCPTCAFFPPSMNVFRSHSLPSFLPPSLRPLLPTPLIDIGFHFLSCFLPYNSSPSSSPPLSPSSPPPPARLSPSMIVLILLIFYTAGSQQSSSTRVERSFCSLPDECSLDVCSLAVHSQLKKVQHLDFPDAKFDTIIDTFGLCVFSDPLQAVITLHF
eukprot:768688-Hanusia_phi.AAC.2